MLPPALAFLGRSARHLESTEGTAMKRCLSYSSSALGALHRNRQPRMVWLECFYWTCLVAWTLPQASQNAFCFRARTKVQGIKASKVVPLPGSQFQTYPLHKPKSHSPSCTWTSEAHCVSCLLRKAGEGSIYLQPPTLTRSIGFTGCDAAFWYPCQ